MSADTMLEKTAVFSFGDLPGAEEPRLYDIDEPTRELPLIAGRFAGREWDPEELRRDFAEENRRDPAVRRRRIRTLSLGALAAMLLLVASLLGQARLVDCNEQTVAAAETAAELREEQNLLLAELQQTRVYEANASFETAALRRGAQTVRPDGNAEDVATVLSVRRGREMRHYWLSFIDGLGVSFH